VEMVSAGRKKKPENVCCKFCVNTVSLHTTLENGVKVFIMMSKWLMISLFKISCQKLKIGIPYGYYNIWCDI